MKLRYRIILKLEKLFFQLLRRLGIYPPTESIAIDSMEIIKNGIPKKKILYLAVKYDYGNKYRGVSYEEYNFFDSLKNIPNIEIVRLDIYSIYRKYGKSVANDIIQEVAFMESVDTLLLILYHDIFDYNILKKLKNIYGIDTILWLFDDDKRYPYTKRLVKCFNKVVTTLKARHKQRKMVGINSYLAQFAVNHYLYRKLPVEKKYDVMFIGQNFENRQEYIEYLIENGVDIHVFGKGWKNSGRISQREMIEMMNQAKIMLNFSSSAGNPHLKYPKGRVFEIPATGSFLLTENCDELEDYFTIGKDLDIFTSKKTFLNKIKYYLKNEAERERIAKNGYEKVLKNHIYEKLFLDILEL